MGDYVDDIIRKFNQEKRKHEIKVGMTLGGRFFLEEMLESGAVANVFRAKDNGTGEDVAVKVVEFGKYIGSEGIARFKREAEILSKYHHPNIVNLRYYDKTDRNLFYVMDLIKGKDLYYLIKDEGKLEPKRAVTMAKKIASALSGMHERAIIHRDVKPENIMVSNPGTKEEDFILIDLGVVKLRYKLAPHLTTTGEFLGTIPFVPPEQIRGLLVDERGDIYSLGAVLYNAVCGKPHFVKKKGEKDTRFMRRILMREPPQPNKLNPRIPIGLNDAILKALAKNPDERYQSCYEFSSALEEFEKNYFTVKNG